MNQKIKYCSLIAIASVLLGYCTLFILDVVFPPDLSRAERYSTIVTDSDGKWLRVYLTSDDAYRIQTDHTTLPPYYLELLLNYEDRDFYQHNGIDFSAIGRAAIQNISNGKVISGGSTLSMQTARLLMPQPRTLSGKIVQAFRAWQLEKRLSKDEILDIYTSLAPVGGNREGLAAASYYYLQKPTDKISLSESAWLIALTQSPQKLSHNKAAAITARNKVLKRARDNNIITDATYQRALAEPLVLSTQPFPSSAPHASDYAKRKNPQATRITTALDASLQNSLAHLLSNALPTQHANANLAGGIIDNHTGNWLAYVGSADFFNNERKGQIDMLQAVRSPGSTLKTFITLFAFDWLNYYPATTIDDTPITSAYRPSNYDGQFLGRISLEQALQLSRNVPAVRLLQAIQPSYFDLELRENGLPLIFPQGAKPNLSIALGGVGIRGVQLAKLYQKLADCTFTEASKLAKQSSCQKVTGILQHSQNQNGRIFFGKEPVAFKTGTSYGWRDRWIFAYTQDYTIVLWSGRADGQFSENIASAQALIPVLRQTIGILPNPPSSAETIAIRKNSNAQLPKRLRHVPSKREHTAEPSISQSVPSPNSLSIVAPLSDSVIEFTPGMDITISIRGGIPPYMYLLNDDIIDETISKQTLVKNVGAGNYQLLVIDSAGQTSKGTFRLQPNKTPIHKSVNWK